MEFHRAVLQDGLSSHLGPSGWSIDHGFLAPRDAPLPPLLQVLGLDDSITL